MWTLDEDEENVEEMRKRERRLRGLSVEAREGKMSPRREAARQSRPLKKSTNNNERRADKWRSDAAMEETGAGGSGAISGAALSGRVERRAEAARAPMPLPPRARSSQHPTYEMTAAPPGTWQLSFLHLSRC
eukprot:7892565-Pyramimonas_sp.AAC.1